MVRPLTSATSARRLSSASSATESATSQPARSWIRSPVAVRRDRAPARRGGGGGGCRALAGRRQQHPPSNEELHVPGPDRTRSRRGGRSGADVDPRARVRAQRRRAAQIPRRVGVGGRAGRRCRHPAHSAARPRVTPSSIRLSWGCRLAPASPTTRHLLAPSRGPPACTLMTHYLCRRTRSPGAEHLILLRMALASHRCR